MSSRCLCLYHLSLTQTAIAAWLTHFITTLLYKANHSTPHRACHTHIQHCLPLLCLCLAAFFVPLLPPSQAKLHEAQGERPAAAHYYALNLARLDAEGLAGADATEALLYLAEYAKVGVVCCGVCW